MRGRSEGRSLIALGVAGSRYPGDAFRGAPRVAAGLEGRGGEGEARGVSVRVGGTGLAVKRGDLSCCGEGARTE